MIEDLASFNPAIREDAAAAVPETPLPTAATAAHRAAAERHLMGSELRVVLAHQSPRAGDLIVGRALDADGDEVVGIRHVQPGCRFEPCVRFPDVLTGVHRLGFVIVDAIGPNEVPKITIGEKSC